ncbi:transposase [Streptomyces sp. NPDC012510]|uniref:IS701 family transposase n=1 Tax=Streptomyces sp. NPDC012510 TaxID=3364838 RepID=UPI0036E5B316
MSGHEELLTDLGTTLFASLPRSDQRSMALTYVRGLLTTPGRKSFRNMAVSLGGPRLEQRLHHFISCSTWDWTPVSRASADALMPVAPPRGWVLRTLVTRREGESTVGVHKRFFAGRGQMLNAQYAVGLWAASTTVCYPLTWRLLLPPEWLQDEARRARASIPVARTPETPVECAVAAYLDLPADLRGRLPVVMDVCGIDTVTAVHRLCSVKVPFLVRAYRGLPLTVVDPALPGHGTSPLSTHRILAAAEGPHGPVDAGPVDAGGPGGGYRHAWPEERERASGTVPGGEEPTRSLVAAVRVRSPYDSDRADGPDGRHDLLLLRTRTDTGQRPDEVWLTNMLDADPGTLLSLTALPRRVDDSTERITARLGIRDFTGRSYDGWNRHATLASVAHAVALLSDEPADLPFGRAPVAETEPSPVGPPPDSRATTGV